MKKIALLALICLTAIATSAAKRTKLMPYPFQPDKKYVGVATKKMVLNSPSKQLRGLQGAYTDGKRYYVLFMQGDAYQSNVLLAEYDMNGRCLRFNDTLKLEHANNLTYVKKWKSFLVTHCQGNGPDKKPIWKSFFRYSLVDAKTFQITKTDTLSFPFYAMAYDKASDRFASARWAGGTIDVCDGQLTHLLEKEVEGPVTLSQGCCTTKDAIWFIRSAWHGQGTEIRTYDWQGNLLHSITVDIPEEAENISIANNVIYVGAANWETGSCIVYTVDIREDDAD